MKLDFIFIKVSPWTTTAMILGFFIGLSWFGPWFLIPALLLCLEIQKDGKQI